MTFDEARKQVAEIKEKELNSLLTKALSVCWATNEAAHQALDLALQHVSREERQKIYNRIRVEANEQKQAFWDAALGTQEPDGRAEAVELFAEYHAYLHSLTEVGRYAGDLEL